MKTIVLALGLLAFAVPARAQAPAVNVPWNPAVPAGTAEHAARKLQGIATSWRSGLTSS